MPATLAQVRRLALGWPSVTEGISYGTVAFHAGKKFMLRLHEDGETLVIRYPRAQRVELIERHPDVFSVTDHYHRYDYVLLHLPAANEKLLAEMIEHAWRLCAPRRAIAACARPGRTNGRG